MLRHQILILLQVLEVFRLVLKVKVLGIFAWNNNSNSNTTKHQNQAKKIIVKCYDGRKTWALLDRPTNQQKDQPTDGQEGS